MGVEAAVRQADLFHDVGDARAVVPASPNGARGGPDDPFVGDFLAAGGGSPGGGSAHMMNIIYQSGAERKTVEAPPGLDRAAQQGAKTQGGQRRKPPAEAERLSSCPSWARTRTLLIQSQACCQLHQGALFTTNWDRDGQAARRLR